MWYLTQLSKSLHCQEFLVFNTGAGITISKKMELEWMQSTYTAYPSLFLCYGIYLNAESFDGSHPASIDIP